MLIKGDITMDDKIEQYLENHMVVTYIIFLFQMFVFYKILGFQITVIIMLAYILFNIIDGKIKR